MRIIVFIALLVLPGTALAERKPPYWNSLAASEVRMRTGPGRQFPASWLYQRAGLPVKVIEVYPNWRKIEDPDGVTGWVQSNLVADARTALVVGGVREMRLSASSAAAVVWRAEPGVVGKITQCGGGWCLFDVKGQVGYIQTAHIWGTAADERLP